jgi:hypothetical protein
MNLLPVTEIETKGECKARRTHYRLTATKHFPEVISFKSRKKDHHRERTPRFFLSATFNKKQMSRYLSEIPWKLILEFALTPPRERHKMTFSRTLEVVCTHAALTKIHHYQKLFDGEATPGMSMEAFLYSLGECDEENIVLNLSQCNCCVRHKIRRPTHVREDTSVRPARTQEDWMCSCYCRCRNMARSLVRLHRLQLTS